MQVYVYIYVYRYVLKFNVREKYLFTRKKCPKCCTITFIVYNVRIYECQTYIIVFELRGFLSTLRVKIAIIAYVDVKITCVYSIASLFHACNVF